MVFIVRWTLHPDLQESTVFGWSWSRVGLETRLVVSWPVVSHTELLRRDNDEREMRIKLHWREKTTFHSAHSHSCHIYIRSRTWLDFCIHTVLTKSNLYHFNPVKWTHPKPALISTHISITWESAVALNHHSGVSLTDQIHCVHGW